MEAVTEPKMLLEIEKELAGPDAERHLARYDAMLVALERRLAAAMKEGLPPDEAPEGSADGEDPQGLTSQGTDLPELPPESDDGMSKALEEYKKRDMPDGTIVTIPYFTDHFVLLTKK